MRAFCPLPCCTVGVLHIACFSQCQKMMEWVISTNLALGSIGLPALGQRTLAVVPCQRLYCKCTVACALIEVT